ncbi:MAG: hypothetical protein LBI54_01820 [Lachnospiraceae bacterium]|nr:hypothetical protein [Lachnospiraceae bacterium]
MRIYGDNYRTPDALLGATLSFNLSSGEVLTIMTEGQIVTSLYLPRMDNDYVLVRNPRNGEYIGVKRDEAETKLADLQSATYRE